MIGAIVPLITGLITMFKGSKITGIDSKTTGSVIDAFSNYINKDAKAQTFIAEQMENARQHDIATFDKTDRFSNRLRSSVRPLVTFAAVTWYIYARLNNIPLVAEDYAIIGGVLAFWFGFRPFEKGQK